MSAFTKIQHASVRSPSPAFMAFSNLAPGTVAAFATTDEQGNVTDGGSKAARQTARAYTISQLASFNEIVGTLLYPYREYLRIPLSNLHKISEKVQKAKSLLEGLQAHKTKKTWPVQIAAIKPPHFQCSTKFETSKTGVEIRKWFREYTGMFKADLLKKAIQQKSSEIQMLQEELNPEVWMKKFIEIITKVYTDGPKEHKIPFYTEGKIEYLQDPNAAVIFEQVQSDLPYLGHTVIRIGEAKELVNKATLQAKLKLQQDADHEMGDPELSNAHVQTKDIQDTVDKAIAKALKEKAQVKTTKHGLRHPIKGLPKPKGGKKPAAKGKGAPNKGARPSNTPNTLKPKNGGSTGGQGSKKRKVSATAEKSSAKKSKKCTYPDAILDLPKDVADNYDLDLHLRTDSLADPAPQYIENGLAKGWIALENQLSVLQKQLVFDEHRIPRFIDQHKVSQFMMDHQLILVPSNKNLGCALIHKEWFIEQALAHLSNPNSYAKITEKEGMERISEVAIACEALGRHPYVATQDLSTGKLTFTQKSHWVRQHSKKMHFIEGISRIRFYTEEKSSIFIVGGDIKAYYPTVPKQRASEVIKEMMDQDPRQEEEHFGSFFEECLDVTDSTVVM
ncbi:hypothetical protein FRC11_005433 [Ceratobasidium sp. 423]|nr:hypothetical protein FRC11_005433 [Ceratobasidium sp. 423]